MNLFASLYRSLLSTTDTAEKSNLIAHYLDQLNENEIIPAIHLLLHGKSGSLISTKALIKLVMIKTNISEDLIKECYTACQDWVETCSLIVANPQVEKSNHSLSSILRLMHPAIPDPMGFCNHMWNSLSTGETWLFNKLITGTVRPLISIVQISQILSAKWKTDQELVHLRLVLYDFKELTLKQLTDPHRNQEELNYVPYTFVKPNEAHINFSLEAQDDYLIEPFIYGERMLVIKTNYALQAYTIQREWRKLDDEEWHKLIPEQSQLEIIISNDKVHILHILLWNGEKMKDIRLQKTIFMEWVFTNKLSNKIEWVPQIEIKDWSTIDMQGDLILKHKEDITKWYRIKPKMHELIAVLWYAEMPSSNQSMNMKLTMAIHNDQHELITICQFPSSDLPSSDQTKLYYWIQNNTVQKFGPVRTVRPIQHFVIGYDRVQVHSRSKAGIKLINSKIQEWKKEAQKIEISKISDIPAKPFTKKDLKVNPNESV
ncbi:MAG: hypothetical protein KA143_06895 [Saprospiraceae bacterium]|nr:hypothetical protein [Saprospiraceae bacterium]